VSGLCVNILYIISLENMQGYVSDKSDGEEENECVDVENIKMSYVGTMVVTDTKIKKTRNFCDTPRSLLPNISSEEDEEYSSKKEEEEDYQSNSSPPPSPTLSSSSAPPGNFHFHSIEFYYFVINT
jgi:hypothetical protein